MLYKKPSNVRYVDMAMYIDSVAYSGNLDKETQEKIYEYIYHITKMLAYKANLFSKNYYYEDFAIYSATRTYLRLTSPKQFESEDNKKPIQPIKSILNYIKSVLRPHKVDFEQEFYAQTIQRKEDDIYEVDFSFGDRLYECTDKLNTFEFEQYIEDICSEIRNFLYKIPYKRNTNMWNNIYISCMLTFLSSVTLSSRDKSYLNSRLSNDYDYISRYVEKVYKKQLKDEPILYHLDDSMSNYIKVLTTEMRHVIAHDLSSITHTYVPSMAGMNNIILADINNGQSEYIED